MAKRPVKSSRLEDVFFRHMVGNMRNGVLAIDGPYLKVRDVDGFRRVAVLAAGTQALPAQQLPLLPRLVDDVTGSEPRQHQRCNQGYAVDGIHCAGLGPGRAKSTVLGWAGKQKILQSGAGTNPLSRRTSGF